MICWFKMNVWIRVLHLFILSFISPHIKSKIILLIFFFFRSISRNNIFKIPYYFSIFHQPVYHDKCYLTIISLIGEQSVHLLTNQVISIALYLWRKNVQEELRISQAFRTFFFHLASTSRHDSSQRGNTIMMCFPKHIKFWKICKLQVNAKLASHIRQNKYVQMRHNLDDFQNPKKWTLTRFEKEPINRVYCGPLLWSQNFFWGNTSCFLKMIQN